jgi:hypothetical protein
MSNACSPICKSKEGVDHNVAPRPFEVGALQVQGNLELWWRSARLQLDIGYTVDGLHDLSALRRALFFVSSMRGSDGTEVCASGDQLAAILAGTAAGATTAGAGAPAASPTLEATSADAATSTTASNDSQPPVITINGKTQSADVHLRSSLRLRTTRWHDSMP